MSNQRTTDAEANPNLRSTTTEYPGLRAAVRWVAKYSLVGASNPAILKRARASLKEASVPLVPGAARDAQWRQRAARAIYRWITRNVEYKYDPRGVEQVQEPAATLALGEGDCDDMVSLGIAMLMAVGVPARIVVMRQNGSDVFNHIYAEYQGQSSGGPRWKPFDVTLDQTGGPATAGDGPTPDLIAEKVVVPVAGSPESLSAQTRQALLSLPADDGVVPDWKLQQEQSDTAPDSTPDSLANADSSTMSTTTRYFSSVEGSSIRGGAAPGTISATQTIAQRAAEVPEKQEVILISPQQYERLIAQRKRSGNYTCDSKGRIIIRDQEGREILPWVENAPGQETDGDARGTQRAGLPGGLGLWVLGGLAAGALYMNAGTKREENQ